MTNRVAAPRAAAVVAAVQQAHEEGEVEIPTVASASRIVALQPLVRGQGLNYREYPTLTRSSAMLFLRDQLSHDVDMPGSGTEQLSGYIYATLHGGEILVNRDDPITRRRFTVAHELGHYLLHALPRLEAGSDVFSESQPGVQAASTEQELGTEGQALLVGAGDTRVEGTEEWELEANQFAAELLMPEQLCAALVEQYRRRFGERRAVLAKRLASELLVSQQAMTYRLQNLGLGRA